MITHHQATREKALNNLKLAKMWLGKVLGELGSLNPYPQSMNPKSSVIEAEADVYKGPLDIEYFTIPSGIKETRRLIEKLLPEYKNMVKEDAEYHPFNSVGMFLKESELRLTEAKLWLGMELGEIRDEELRINDCALCSMKVDRIMEEKKEMIKEVPGKGGQLGRWPVDRNIAGEKYNAERE
ncbi:MAG: hypothetical protein IT280_04895 [Ignavibacteria bacterium]|nr:hypothetical protein [Ignavibacteria bacterium]